MPVFCNRCGKQIFDFIHPLFLFDQRRGMDVLVCKKCYVKELGNFVEKNPISTPTIKGGMKEPYVTGIRTAGKSLKAEDPPEAL